MEEPLEDIFFLFSNGQRRKTKTLYIRSTITITSFCPKVSPAECPNNMGNVNYSGIIGKIVQKVDALGYKSQQRCE